MSGRATVDELVALSSEVVQRLPSGDYDGIAAFFDDTLTRLLPPVVLRHLWLLLIGRLGAFVGIEGTTGQEEEGGAIVVGSRCTFERGALVIRQVYDADGRLTGLHFLDPAPDDAL